MFPVSVWESLVEPQTLADSSSAVLKVDSQDDSQHRERQRTGATVRGFTQAGFDSVQTSANAAGRRARGLQNRGE
jgi:hypothetical protein